MSRLVQSGDLPAQPGLPARRRLARKAGLAIAAFGLLTVLAGCNEVHDSRAAQPLSREMLALMQEKGVAPQAPMLIRAYKKEAEFEVWKMRPDGSYELLKTFPICRWSGQLGPKTHEGDRQSPEGFYSITPAMMNPNSAYYLSFNVGYPNAYDRAHGATGGAVMVHGVCSSAGCFSMTDAQIAEIYALARESFAGGQHAIQMQSYPFHMNVQNLAKYRLDPNMAFWKELKKGHDHFEARKADVAVAVCGGHYVFDAKSANGQPLDAEAPCPPLKLDPEIEAKAAERQRADDAAVAELVAKGERPVRLVYQDGGQHPAFSHRIAEVSRPDALTPPVELALDDPNARYNAKARSASTAAALVLAQAQLRAQPLQAQAIAPEPVAPSEKFAAAALGAFHHDDAKTEVTPLPTERGNGVNAANDAGAATASIAPKPVNQLSKAVEPKPGIKFVAKSTVAKSTVAKSNVAKTSVMKTGADKPQAARPGKQKIAEAATLR
jgi:murein L,D-transpeptidase YafK